MFKLAVCRLFGRSPGCWLLVITVTIVVLVDTQLFGASATSILIPKADFFVAPDEVRFQGRFNILSTPRLVAPKLRHLFPDLFLPFRSLVILG